MPDIVLGTIIGAIIAGLSSYFIARQQINARREEFSQQLSHQEREGLINRLIEARKQVLIPLREAINMSLELSNNYLILMVQMKEASKKDDGAELREAIKRWEEASDKSKEANSNLKILIGQLSDAQLLRMIEEVQANQEKEGEKVIEVTILAHQPESRNIETMKRLNSELREIHNTTLEILLPVNKRIEELLSGETSN